MQNIIFVDFDGPLLPGKMHLFQENRNPKTLPMFDAFAVRVFNIWAKYSNAKIVLSTNWVAHHSIDDLKEYLRLNGLGFDYHDVITTPKYFSPRRNREILEWLEENAEKDDVFIAVDDDPACKFIEEGIQDNEYSGKWIAVDYQNGMSYENFIDGCRVLNIDLVEVNKLEFGIDPIDPDNFLANLDIMI